ncbi:NUDIX hydrolase [Streptomyces vietnamensis]|uniref:NUDIX hydrolase n=1 Tax=Streptomyces vietnamensis TaxID=362257 RepID=UPI00341F9180
MAPGDGQRSAQRRVPGVQASCVRACGSLSPEARVGAGGGRVSGPLPSGGLVRVCAVIVNAGEICLIHRRRAEGVDQYTLPGGLRHVGEGATAALARELKEELGLDAAWLFAPPVLRWVQDQITIRPGSMEPFQRLHLIHTVDVPDGIRSLIATTEQDADDTTRIVWASLARAAVLHLYPAVGAALATPADTWGGPVELPSMVDGTYVWR